jgi:hypothetical protein
MDLWDRIALFGRRYEQRRSVESGSPRLSLGEVLRMYNGKGIMELTSRRAGGEERSLRPDPERKLKISLLDVISEIQPQNGGWYEVFETAPSGDLSRVRILGHASENETTGEIRMLVGRRSLDSYFLEDPLFDSIRRRLEAQ